MGNVVSSVSSGFGQLIDKILGHPLDFLSGKNCKSVCAPTWDFICYVENFCVSQLLKLIMVASLVYFLLLFLFLLYKLGVCQCICHIICGTIWGCFATCFSSLEFCCTYCCSKLQNVKRNNRRRRRRRDIEEFTPPIITSEEEEEHNLGSRKHKRSHERRSHIHEHLRRSLRPVNHVTHLELSSRSIDHPRRKLVLDDAGDPASHVHHHVRIARSSRFSHKGSSHRTRKHHPRR
ncbi:uncharacterized protein LOC127257202 [Andrographis paniculata]|uniref:uncharacterized protein LOC127257202 n=1 Tax=Andrographis paniculata TaxID=175694 RepID=UPI0021E81087|nr:uncharacterized protein LOC127257202 [Andrographis paniculata]